MIVHLSYLVRSLSCLHLKTLYQHVAAATKGCHQELIQAQRPCQAALNLNHCENTAQKALREQAAMDLFCADLAAAVTLAASCQCRCCLSHSSCWYSLKSAPAGKSLCCCCCCVPGALDLPPGALIIIIAALPEVLDCTPLCCCC